VATGSSSLQASRRTNPVVPTSNSVSAPSASALAKASTPQQVTLGVSTGASPATTANPSPNPAFLAAIQKHLDKLAEVERQAFLQANTTITPDSLLKRIGSLDKQHASTSSFRPHAEKIARFLSLLDRLLGGVTIAIQANPDISSIAVGGIKLIVDIAIGFTKFFGKLTDMLDRLSEIIAPLERYAERFELLNVGNALIDVYGDIIDFCKASSALFQDKKGRYKVPTTLQVFSHLLWVPFEAEFGEIAGRMDHHCDILLHAAQAELLYADKGKYPLVPTLWHHSDPAQSRRGRSFYAGYPRTTSIISRIILLKPSMKVQVTGFCRRASSCDGRQTPRRSFYGAMASVSILNHSATTC
jgi:hypothetical protein